MFRVKEVPVHQETQELLETAVPAVLVAPAEAAAAAAPLEIEAPQVLLEQEIPAMLDPAAAEVVVVIKTLIGGVPTMAEPPAAADKGHRGGAGGGQLGSTDILAILAGVGILVPQTQEVLVETAVLDNQELPAVQDPQGNQELLEIQELLEMQEQQVNQQQL
jgi:hypothetical protein